MNVKTLAVLGFIFCSGAVYALHTDKMRLTESCYDARLYMDGGIDVDLLSGGLNFHRTLQVYKKQNRKEVLVGSFLVTSQTPSKSMTQEYLAGSDAKLSIFTNQAATSHGTPSKLEGIVDGEKVSITMNCITKTY